MNRLRTPSGLPLYSEQDFVEHAKAKDLPEHVAVIKGFTADVKAVKDTNRFTFTISTAGVDRDRDVIAVSGWDLTNYKKNPVVLFGHDYHSLPVGRSLSISTDRKALTADVEFASKDIYPFADTVRQMVAGGFLRAASVGFKPLKYMYNEERRGVDIEGSELLEWSIVPVPANAECLVQLSASLSPSALAEFAGSCEQFMEACKGKGQWVVSTDLRPEPAQEKDGAHRDAVLPAVLHPRDLDALASKIKELIMPVGKGLAGCTRTGGCPTNADGSAQNCTMADCPMKAAHPEGPGEPENDQDPDKGAKALTGEIVFEDEADYVFGISKEAVVETVRAATVDALKAQIAQLFKEQIDYARGRIQD